VRKQDRILLTDADLGCGILQFMLKLKNEYSLLDALENALRMDERLWADLVTPVGNVDVMQAGKITPNVQIEPEQIAAFVRFSRRLYSALCFDLSGHFDRASMAVLTESKRIFLVCTPEIPSMHLAKQKLEFLRERELSGRVEIILNRTKARAAYNQDTVEEVLGKPVRWSFSNDYAGVTNAMREGTTVASGSELGQQIRKFAESLCESPAAESEAPRKFLNFFTVARTPLARRVTS